MAQVISSADFGPKVLEAQGKVIVDFFADWCGPCRALAPVIDEITTELQGKAAVYKMNVDQCPDISSRYNVMSIPTIVLFENGQVVKKLVGGQPKSVLLQLAE